MKTYKYKKLWHNLTNSRIENCTTILSEEQQFVVVKAEYSLVSQGTEKLVTTKTLDTPTCEKMKVPYQEGKLGTDFTYGYSVVGKVIEGPIGIKNKRVHLMHPHQELAFVNPEDVFVITGLDAKVSSLASNTETAVNALWDSDCNVGDKILIIGYGMIGALIAAILKENKTNDLIILEQDDFRFSSCRSHGYKTFNNPGDVTGEYDIIFNTSNNEQGLQTAIDKTGLGSKIIELGWHGKTNICLNLGDKFHYNRVKIISSQVSNLPPLKTERWNYLRRKELVFRLLKTIDFSHLLTREIPFDESPRFYDQLRNEKVKDIGVIIKY